MQNVLPGMEAAFIDIGTPKNGVLYRGDVIYDPSDVEGGQRPRIESVLRNGQSIIVQVTKNPIGHKGARLTQEVSLAGRFVVMVPGQPQTYGISKRLPDDERKRLRQVLDRLRPADAGLIVRTAAEGATEEELERDMLRLNEQWRQISEFAKKAKPGSLLYKEPPLATRLIREEFTKEFRGVVIDDRTLYEEVRSYVDAIAPELADRVELYDAEAENLPIFEKFHVHEQLHKALERKVWLPSGGSLVIERTEALTVIDVNTGKNVGTSNLEETVYRNNLEAAGCIARELRLRDIGGIIVIDFIDMEIRVEPRGGRDVVPGSARPRQDPHAGVPDLRARPGGDDAQAGFRGSGRGVLHDLPRVQRPRVHRRRVPARVGRSGPRSSGPRVGRFGYYYPVPERPARVPRPLDRSREAPMYAVIQTGGKQYRVAEGDRLDVELLDGDDVTLQPVLLVDGEQVLSTPSALSGVSVTRTDRRPRQGPEDPRLHVQEQVEPAAVTGATASTTRRSRSPGSRRARREDLPCRRRRAPRHRATVVTRTRSGWA